MLDQHLELKGKKIKSMQAQCLESFQKCHTGILEQVCSHMKPSICVCKQSVCVLKGGVQGNRRGMWCAVTGLFPTNMCCVRCVCLCVRPSIKKKTSLPTNIFHRSDFLSWKWKHLLGQIFAFFMFNAFNTHDLESLDPKVLIQKSSQKTTISLVVIWHFVEEL